MKTVGISKTFNHLNFSHLQSLLLLLTNYSFPSVQAVLEKGQVEAQYARCCTIITDFSFPFTTKRQLEFKANLLSINFLSFAFTGYKVLSKEAFTEVCKPVAKETS